MDKLLNRIPDHARKVRFLIVGGWNTFFGYGVFVAFDTGFAALFASRRLAYMSAIFVSSIVAVLSAYIMHRRITFRSVSKGRLKFMEFFRFCATYAFTIALSIILLPVFVEIFRFSPKSAGLLVTLLCAILSYFSHAKFSFKDNK